VGKGEISKTQCFLQRNSQFFCSRDLCFPFCLVGPFLLVELECFPGGSRERPWGPGGHWVPPGTSGPQAGCPGAAHSPRSPCPRRQAPRRRWPRGSHGELVGAQQAKQVLWPWEQLLAWAVLSPNSVTFPNRVVLMPLTPQGFSVGQLAK